MVRHDHKGDDVAVSTVIIKNGFPNDIPEFLISEQAAAVSVVEQAFLHWSDSFPILLLYIGAPWLGMILIETVDDSSQIFDPFRRQRISKTKRNELQFSILMPMREIAAILDVQMLVSVKIRIMGIH